MDDRPEDGKTGSDHSSIGLNKVGSLEISAGSRHARRASGATVPLVRSARALALAASSVIALVGVVAGAVRLLPWLLEPQVPWRVAVPFARGLAALAFESALAVGWPIGWALACFRAVENGEARVLQALGEPPARTIRRLAPQGAAFAIALSTVAVVCASDANAPGRVVTELVVGARAACAAVRTPTTYIVPFTGMTWLCPPDREPRLVGTVPGKKGGVVATARGARISGDFRAIELDDARVHLPGDPPVALHAGTITMHGMAPWAHASTLPPPLRAFLLALSAWSAASVAAWGVLRGAVRARVGAIALGMVGPLAALGLLRTLERADASFSAFLLVPFVACGCAVACGGLLSRLNRRRRTSSVDRRA